VAGSTEFSAFEENERLPKALDAFDSRDSLCSSSFASLTPAVLTSSGFVERVSPFQSARKAVDSPSDGGHSLSVADQCLDIDPLG
jgi:hypothetical protein